MYSLGGRKTENNDVKTALSNTFIRIYRRGKVYRAYTLNSKTKEQKVRRRNERTGRDVKRTAEKEREKGWRAEVFHAST